LPRAETKNAEQLVQAFEREILDYLRFRPDQIDDLDGILYWWLFHRRYIRNSELVEKALARLVEAGSVARIERGDGRVLFGASDDFKAAVAAGSGPDDEVPSDD
jgi:hypothetical protein